MSLNNNNRHFVALCVVFALMFLVHLGGAVSESRDISAPGATTCGPSGAPYNFSSIKRVLNVSAQNNTYALYPCGRIENCTNSPAACGITAFGACDLGDAPGTWSYINSSMPSAGAQLALTGSNCIWCDSTTVTINFVCAGKGDNSLTMLEDGYETQYRCNWVFQINSTDVCNAFPPQDSAVPVVAVA